MPAGLATPTKTRRRLVITLVFAVILLPVVLAVSAFLKIRATILSSVPAPESATGLRVVSEVRTKRSMVVAAHPEAARVGGAVLAAGGSAMDAAVAVQAALTLVEPQSSGIGGGAFLLYFDAVSRTLRAYDGREMAPAAASPRMFLNEKGEPLSFPAALLGGRSVGAPGVVRMLALGHAQHGRLPWSRLFDEASALADDGFDVTPRLHDLLGMDPVLSALPPTRAYFFGADGWSLPVGARLRNPALAATLRTIAKDGPDAFYAGPIAQDIVDAVHTFVRPSLPRSALDLVLRSYGVAASATPTVAVPGGLTTDDLKAYRAVERSPICLPYRRFRVCGFPPPTSGGTTVLASLRMLERFDLAKLGPTSPVARHLLAEAERLAFADRDRWVADPDFAKVPTEGLLEEGYLRTRSAGISEEKSLGAAKAGVPPGAQARLETGTTFEVPSTTHFVIVDAQGNIASMTSSIEFGFGSHILVRGFLLNNQLTDFSFQPERDGRPVQNAVAPGKRPRSSMAPFIVFDGESGRPVLALGSPGGSRIIGYVLQSLVGVLDWGLSPQQAVSLPHVLNLNGKTEVEDVGWADAAARSALIEGLTSRGHEVTIGQQASGLHAVQLDADGLRAGIDPRREGGVAGE